MSNKKYDEVRSNIPADIDRLVKTQAGHSCTIAKCDEHTYLEIHHIDEDRENNSIENLILLCVKHHKMAHAGKIDRKSLKQYKSMLKFESPSVSPLDARAIQHLMEKMHPEGLIAQLKMKNLLGRYSRISLMPFVLFHSFGKAPICNLMTQIFAMQASC
jgi:hypothetical protein